MAWARGNAQAERVEQVAFAQSLLRRLLANAYPLFLANDPTRTHVTFDGSAKAVTFLAPAPIAMDGGGLSWFALSADVHNGRADLVMATRPELAVQGAPATPAKRVLLGGAQTVEFAYFGMARSDRAAQWHDDWTGAAAIPELIRVRVRFVADDARVWPELVVAPRIGVDVGCAYDTLTRRCKGR
jgi:general secretion pathway protein J